MKTSLYIITAGMLLCLVTSAFSLDKKELGTIIRNIENRTELSEQVKKRLRQELQEKVAECTSTSESKMIIETALAALKNGADERLTALACETARKQYRQELREGGVPKDVRQLVTEAAGLAVKECRRRKLREQDKIRQVLHGVLQDEFQIRREEKTRRRNRYNFKLHKTGRDECNREEQRQKSTCTDDNNEGENRHRKRGQ